MQVIEPEDSFSIVVMEDAMEENGDADATGPRGRFARASAKAISSRSKVLCGSSSTNWKPEREHT